MTDAQVKDAFTKDAMCIREDENLNDVRDTLSQSRFRSFPVVDQKGRLTGILSLSDYENIPADVQPAPTIRKISTSDVVTVTEAEPLFSALGKISSGDFAILPVIDPKERTVLGIISRSDILRTLHRSMKK
ncbi:MAG: CBS domain-containing protein [Deltaproteobacteria bacterium]